MADDKIEIEVVLGGDETKKGFSSIEKQSKTAGKNIEKDLGGSFKKLNVAVLALGAALSAAFSTRALVRAASQQEEAINKLNTSLALAGNLTKETSLDIQNFASELQKITTVGDETTLGLVALAQNFTKTADEAKDLTRAAIDLSAATGMSLEGAVNNLGRTLSGSTGLLAQTVPALKNLTKESLLAGEGIQLVLDRFSGAAASQVQTFAGSTKQLSNSFGDLLEELGFFIIRNPVIIKLIQDTNEVVNKLGTAVRNFADSGGFQNITFAVLAIGKALNFVVIGPLEIFINAFKTGLVTIELALFAVINQVSKALSLFAQLLPATNSIRLGIEQFAQGAALAVEETSAKLAESAANTFTNFSATSAIDQYIESLASLESANDSTLKNVDRAIENTAKVALISADTIADAFEKNMTVGITNGFASLGAALATGENGFESFGKSILSSLGDFAIQVGSLVIGIGKAATAVASALTNFFTGPLAIPAGIALIALGGALKAKAGGPASATAGATPSAGGGVGGIPDTGDSGFSENEIQEVATEVNIKVEGALLDPRGTAQAISELLSDISRSNGISVRTA